MKRVFSTRRGALQAVTWTETLFICLLALTTASLCNSQPQSSSGGTANDTFTVQTDGQHFWSYLAAADNHQDQLANTVNISGLHIENVRTAFHRTNSAILKPGTVIGHAAGQGLTGSCLYVPRSSSAAAAEEGEEQFGKIYCSPGSSDTQFLSFSTNPVPSALKESLTTYDPFGNNWTSHRMVTSNTEFTSSIYDGKYIWFIPSPAVDPIIRAPLK